MDRCIALLDRALLQASEFIKGVCKYRAACKRRCACAVLLVVGIDRAPPASKHRAGQLRKVVASVVLIAVCRQLSPVRNDAVCNRERKLTACHAAACVVVLEEARSSGSILSAASFSCSVHLNTTSI